MSRTAIDFGYPRPPLLYSVYDPLPCCGATCLMWCPESHRYICPCGTNHNARVKREWARTLKDLKKTECSQ